MVLTTITIRPSNRVSDSGVAVLVGVNEEGKFSATFQDENYEDDRLEGLRRQLATAILASRFEVQFYSVDGRAGTMRGYHAGNHDLLVTWSDGEMGRMRSYTPVFREISPETVAELSELRAQIERATTRIQEITGATEQASDLFNEAFGHDVTDYSFNPEVALT